MSKPENVDDINPWSIQDLVEQEDGSQLSQSQWLGGECHRTTSHVAEDMSGSKTSRPVEKHQRQRIQNESNHNRAKEYVTEHSQYYYSNVCLSSRSVM